MLRESVCLLGFVSICVKVDIWLADSCLVIFRRRSVFGKVLSAKRVPNISTELCKPTRYWKGKTLLFSWLNKFKKV